MSDELLQAARDDAAEAEAFALELENMLTVAIIALKKIAACDDDNVAKYIQTVDTLALDALDAIKEIARTTLADIEGEQP